MGVHTADSQFSFRLPTLSYIDARWEEPALRAPAAAPGHTGLAAWLSRQASNFITWRRDSAAAAELALMSDHELMDIGVSRSDIPRVFDHAANEDLRQRGLCI
jgi:uncharacterized protein YjiS (DUF1127 family)